MKLKDKKSYTDMVADAAELYELDVEMFPSVRLERICEILTDKTLSDDDCLRFIKEKLYL